MIKHFFQKKNFFQVRSSCKVKISKKLWKNEGILKTGQVFWIPQTFSNKNGKFHENPSSASKVPRLLVRVTFKNEVPRSHFC